MRGADVRIVQRGRAPRTWEPEAAGSYGGTVHDGPRRARLGRLLLDQLSSTRRVAYPIRAIAYNEKGSEFRRALPRHHQPGTRTGEEHENRSADVGNPPRHDQGRTDVRVGQWILPAAGHHKIAHVIEAMLTITSPRSISIEVRR